MNYPYKETQLLKSPPCSSVPPATRAGERGKRYEIMSTNNITTTLTCAARWLYEAALAGLCLFAAVLTLLVGLVGLHYCATQACFVHAAEQAEGRITRQGAEEMEVCYMDAMGASCRATLDEAPSRGLQVGDSLRILYHEGRVQRARGEGEFVILIIVGCLFLPAILLPGRRLVILSLDALLALRNACRRKGRTGTS